MLWSSAPGPAAPALCPYRSSSYSLILQPLTSLPKFSAIWSLAFLNSSLDAHQTPVFIGIQEPVPAFTLCMLLFRVRVSRWGFGDFSILRHFLSSMQTLWVPPLKLCSVGFNIRFWHSSTSYLLINLVHRSLTGAGNSPSPLIPGSKPSLPCAISYMLHP